MSTAAADATTPAMPDFDGLASTVAADEIRAGDLLEIDGKPRVVLTTTFSGPQRVCVTTYDPLTFKADKGAMVDRRVSAALNVPRASERLYSLIDVTHDWLAILLDDDTGSIIDDMQLHECSVPTIRDPRKVTTRDGTVMSARDAIAAGLDVKAVVTQINDCSVITSLYHAEGDREVTWDDVDAVLHAGSLGASAATGSSAARAAAAGAGAASASTAAARPRIARGVFRFHRDSLLVSIRKVKVGHFVEAQHKVWRVSAARTARTGKHGWSRVFLDLTHPIDASKRQTRIANRVDSQVKVEPVVVEMAAIDAVDSSGLATLVGIETGTAYHRVPLPTKWCRSRRKLAQLRGAIEWAEHRDATSASVAFMSVPGDEAYAASRRTAAATARIKVVASKYVVDVQSVAIDAQVPDTYTAPHADSVDIGADEEPDTDAESVDNDSGGATGSKWTLAGASDSRDSCTGGASSTGSGKSADEDAAWRLHGTARGKQADAALDDCAREVPAHLLSRGSVVVMGSGLLGKVVDVTRHPSSDEQRTVMRLVVWAVLDLDADACDAAAEQVVTIDSQQLVKEVACVERHLWRIFEVTYDARVGVERDDGCDATITLPEEWSAPTLLDKMRNALDAGTGAQDDVGRGVHVEVVAVTRHSAHKARSAVGQLLSPPAKVVLSDNEPTLRAVSVSFPAADPYDNWVDSEH